jgi:hypothetical protein
MPCDVYQQLKQAEKRARDHFESLHTYQGGTMAYAKTRLVKEKRDAQKAYSEASNEASQHHYYCKICKADRDAAK